MKYNGVNIHFCWLPFGQGLVINSKRIVVKPVRNLSKTHIHIPYTCEVIQHELDHCSKIKRLGWFNFMFTIIWRYVWKGYKQTEWEKDADLFGTIINSEIEKLVLDYCKQNNYKYYY